MLVQFLKLWRGRLLFCGAKRCGVGLTFEEWDAGLLAVTAVAPASPAAVHLRSGDICLGDVLEEVLPPTWVATRVPHL